MKGKNESEGKKQKEILSSKELKVRVKEIIKGKEYSVEEFSDEDYLILEQYYGELTQLEVDGNVFLFHPPEDWILNSAARMTTDEDNPEFMEANDVILFNSVINGSEFIRENLPVKRALRKRVKELNGSKRAIVKKR